jgi:hypothetical protein
VRGGGAVVRGGGLGGVAEGKARQGEGGTNLSTSRR